MDFHDQSPAVFGGCSWGEEQAKFVQKDLKIAVFWCVN